MDEPTNHLDIQSKEIIKLALNKFEGTLIVISHDREFLQGLADKIFEFRNGKMKEFLGNIDEYLEYRQKESLREVSMEKAKLESSRTSPKQEHTHQNRDKSSETSAKTEVTTTKNTFVSKEQKALQNKIKKVEEKISQLELEIEAFEVDFSKSNPSEALETYNAKKEELDLALQEWEYLGSQLN